MKKVSIFQTIFIYFLIACFILFGLTIYKNYTVSKENSPKKYTYNALINDIENNNIAHISAINIKPDENNSGFATIIFNDDAKSIEVLPIPSISSFMDIVHSNLKDTNIITTQPADKPSNTPSLLMPILVIVIVIVVILILIANQSKSMPNKASNFGKNKAKLIVGNQTKVTFKDVAGLKEEKYDL